jgi:peptidoglycan/LPS O-acetylase OafA/YrhL
MDVQTTTTRDAGVRDRPVVDRARVAVGEQRAYVPGITGLRALAIIGVIVAATGNGWLTGGGTVGIELFFVLSGYLTVTTLMSGDAVHPTLVTTLRRCGARARRMLPALLTLLGGVSLFVLADRPEELYRLGGDVRATLVGVVNWHLMAEPAGSGPSTLEHLWAIAVGVQLTVVVALVVIAVRSPRARTLAAVAAVGMAVAASVALTVLTTDGDVGPRLLYGTDVRSGGLLLGAALGLVLRPVGLDGVGGVRGRRLRTVGLLAMCGLIAIMLTTAPTAAWFGRGGLLVTDVVAVLALASIMRGAPFALLERPVTQWVGLRAYAMYLWHWPVIVALGGQATVARPVYTAVYLLAVVLLGDLTYRFVEVPLESTWSVPGTGTAGRPGLAAGVAALACGAACAAALLTPPPAS